jgi:hypothetical protein
MSDNTFYLRWIFANGIGEAIGLGSTFVLGMIFGPYLTEEHGVWAIFAGLLIAVLLGVILEGVIVGYFQGTLVICAIFTGSCTWTDYRTNSWLCTGFDSTKTRRSFQPMVMGKCHSLGCWNVVNIHWNGFYTVGAA